MFYESSVHIASNIGVALAALPPAQATRVQAPFRDTGTLDSYIK